MLLDEIFDNHNMLEEKTNISDVAKKKYRSTVDAFYGIVDSIGAIKHTDANKQKTMERQARDYGRKFNQLSKDYYADGLKDSAKWDAMQKALEQMRALEATLNTTNDSV